MLDLLYQFFFYGKLTIKKLFQVVKLDYQGCVAIFYRLVKFFITLKSRTLKKQNRIRYYRVDVFKMILRILMQ